MEIYPEDLGPRQCRQVLEDRLLRGGHGWAEPSAALTVLPSGRVLLPNRRETIPTWLWVIWDSTAAWTVGGIFGSVWWGAFCLIASLGFLWWRRRGGPAQTAPAAWRGFAAWRGVTAPPTGTYARLSEPEISLLHNGLRRKGNEDALLDLYLEMIWSAMHLSPLPAGQPDTEKNAREAIRALGGAIEALPPRPLDGVPADYAGLQAMAASLAADAPLESDPVVAASLHRRAEALRGQAETVARVRVLLRRNEALRAELSDQIGALRTSLAAASLGGGDGGPELAGLAARIHRVASEANAVTAARVEVDALLSQRDARADAPGAEEEVQQVLGLNGETL